MDEKKFSWTRLFRVMIALTVVLAMLLCGCAGTGESNTDDDDDDEGSSQNGDKNDGEGGDEGGNNDDGKVEPEDLVHGIAGIYGDLIGTIGNGMETPNFGYEYGIVLTVGDQIISNLEAQLAASDMDIDLDFMKTIGLDLEMISKQDMIKLALVAKLGNTQIVSGEAIMDIKGSMAYLAIPELSSKYLAAQLGTDVSVSDITAQLEEYAGLIDALPSEKVLDAMLIRYLNVVKEELDDKTTSTETLTYGGVSQNVDVATYNVNRSDVLDMVEAILKEAQKDEDLEQTLDAIAVWYNEYQAEIADDYGYTWEDVDMHQLLMDGIEETLEDLEEAKQTLEDALFLKVNVYSSNESMVGFKIEMHQDSYSAIGMTAYSIASGSNTAMYVDISGVQFAGTGTVSGGKCSGTYKLIVNGTEMLTIETKDFDENVLTKDALKGTVTLRFSNALIQSMDLGSLITESTKIEIALDINESKPSMEMKCYQGETFIIGMAFTGKVTSAGNISVPSNTVDTTDQSAMQSWMENMNFDTILKNLRNAGVPSELMDVLEQSLTGGGQAMGNGPIYSNTDESWG